MRAVPDWGHSREGQWKKTDMALQKHLLWLQRRAVCEQTPGEMLGQVNQRAAHMARDLEEPR